MPWCTGSQESTRLSALEFHLHLMLGFLAYSLAFFAVALAVVMARRQEFQLPLTRSLPALAAFAFLQGLVEWMDMPALISMGGAMFSGHSSMQLPRTLILAASYLFLLWFGLDLIARAEPQRLRLRWLAPLLLLFWAGAALALAQGQLLPAAGLSASVEVGARYLLVLPAGFLATWGFHKQKRMFDRLGMPHVGKDCLRVGVLFIPFSIIAGRLFSQPQLSSSTDAAAEQLLSYYRSPAHLVPALLAVGIAFYLLRIMRAYQQELQVRAEHAEAELRGWNETLERKILDRTHELDRQRKEAEALYQVGTEISSLQNLDVILNSVADYSVQLLRADLATVTLVDEDGPVRVKAVSGARTAGVADFKAVPGIGLVGRVVRTGVASSVDDYLADAGMMHMPEMDSLAAAEGLHAMLAVPIKMGSEVLGAMCVASRGGRRFDGDDERLLARLAVITAIAVQDSRLQQKAHQVAVLEERERLGREIHDGLAQALAALAMMTRAAQSRINRGQVSRVQSDLEQMEKVAHESYADAREAILALRVSTLGATGLVAALGEYIRRLRHQCGLEVGLSVSQDWPESIPGDTETQVIRIVQEALSNVRKHAEAQRASVELSVKGGRGHVRIRDDGRGFDVTGSPKGPGGFGMQTMRERASAIGAILEVTTTPGEGTEVLLWLPGTEAVGGVRPTRPRLRKTKQMGQSA